MLDRPGGSAYGAAALRFRNGAHRGAACCGRPMSEGEPPTRSNDFDERLRRFAGAGLLNVFRAAKEMNRGD